MIEENQIITKSVQQEELRIDSLESELTYAVNSEKSTSELNMFIPHSVELSKLFGQNISSPDKKHKKKFIPVGNTMDLLQEVSSIYNPRVDMEEMKQEVFQIDINFNVPSTNSESSNEIFELRGNMDDLYKEVSENYTVHRLIFKRDVEELTNLLEKFSQNEELLHKIVNMVDLRGNTPTMLSVLLRTKDRAQEYLDILSVLFSYSANPKLKNIDKYSPLEIASANGDSESVCLIYEFLLQRRNAKIARNKEKASRFLLSIPDFYLEMNWEINVPLVGFLMPKDTCKIWKFKNNVRMDYTFAQFKNLKTIRRPSSFLFRENKFTKEKEVFRIDMESKNYFNPFEPLEEDEKLLIIQEIMNSHRLEGEFKLKNCQISQSKSYWSGKPVFDTVNGTKAQKYEVNITAFMNFHNKEKFEYEELEPATYFDKSVELKKKITLLMDEKKLKTHIADGLKVKNDRMREQIMKLGNNKDKKLKAIIWVAEDYPIKSSHLVALFDSLSSANEYTQKIKEFLNDEEVKKIIDKNGFPIKITIPINFFVDITVNFAKFKKLSKETDPKIEDLYSTPPNYQRMTRKAVQNLAKDNKKRLGYANIQG